MATAGTPLLLTGQGTPNHWGMTLPDLQSRIDAAGHAALDLPDDFFKRQVVRLEYRRIDQDLQELVALTADINFQDAGQRLHSRHFRRSG